MSDQQLGWNKRKEKLPAVTVQRLEERHSCRDVKVGVSVLDVAPGWDVSTVNGRMGLNFFTDIRGLTRGRISEFSGHVTFPSVATSESALSLFHCNVS